MDEHEAIRRVQAGDAEAFRILVEAYQRRLFGLVRSYVREPEQQEDLVQEAFLRCFRGLRAFDPVHGGFAPWLYAIARNRCRDHLRARARRPQPETLVGDTLPAPGDAREAGDGVERALARLTAEQRTAFLLLEVHGFSVAEAAEVAQVAPGTIKSRAARARAELRALLAARSEAEA